MGLSSRPRERVKGRKLFPGVYYTGGNGNPGLVD